MNVIMKVETAVICMCQLNIRMRCAIGIEYIGGASSYILVYTDVPLEWVTFLTAQIYEWGAIFTKLLYQSVVNLFPGTNYLINLGHKHSQLEKSGETTINHNNLHS